MLNDFYPVFEFIIRPFKTPDKGEKYEFDHLKLIVGMLITSSIGEKIKKSSEISECFKIMGSQLSFFPYAIRGSMHELGEFYDQPPSNLHTSLRGRTRG